MSTLIAVYSGDKCVGRCDAHCYDAIHPQCDCVCGGKNHGVGQKKAEENTREYCEEWIEQYKKAKDIKDGKGKVNGDLFQISLF